MGEYARYEGQNVKIGTCEDMYYLRWDQAHKVQPLASSVDPAGQHAGQLRFRFPFPDEDGIEPGDFRNFDRGVRVDGVRAPAELDGDHYTVQFKADNGYLVSLPCPEAPADHGFTIHRNGYGGAVHLVQQRWHEGRLVGVVGCGGCGMRWRLATLEDAEPVATALRAEADRRCHVARMGGHYRNDDGTYDEEAIAYQGAWHRKVADRLLAGYSLRMPAPRMSA